MSIQQAVDI